MLCGYERLEIGSRLSVWGVWSLATLPMIDDALRAQLPAEGVALPVSVDGSGLDAIDTAGALVLRTSLGPVGPETSEIRWTGLRDAHRSIIDLVCAHLTSAGVSAADPAGAGEAGRPAQESEKGSAQGPEHGPARSSDRAARAGGTAALERDPGFLAPVAFGREVAGFPAASLGRKIVEGWQFVVDTISWFGRILAALGQVLRQPGRLRWRELFAQLGQVCVSAVPVIALVSFLIGLVIAYLLGLQATQYGANIFVVDGVALGLAREFSPLIVAVILAGRSGSAFAAQLGTMRLTEEIDAIRMLGLSVDQVLLVPRVVSLVLALPLLVFVANLVGMLGAMTIADRMLDIGPAQFLERLQVALAPRHLIIGLAKAPVFALAIAVVGCRMGMTVPRDARSIGRHTTSTVVQSIVSVIVLDALFAVLLQELRW